MEVLYTPEEELLPDLLKTNQAQRILNRSRDAVRRTRQHMLCLETPNDFRFPKKYTKAIQMALADSEITKPVTVAREFSRTQASADLIDEEQNRLRDELLGQDMAADGLISQTDLSTALNLSEIVFDGLRQASLLEVEVVDRRIHFTLASLPNAFIWVPPETWGDTEIPLL